jgi:hypothetical protein
VSRAHAPKWLRKGIEKQSKNGAVQVTEAPRLFPRWKVCLFKVSIPLNANFVIGVISGEY